MLAPRDDLGLETLLAYIFFRRGFSSSNAFMRAINDASMPPYLAPFIKRGVDDAVLAPQLRYRAAGFGLLEDGDDLAVGKAGRLYVELSVLSRKFYF